jgi:hypothetical protein
LTRRWCRSPMMTLGSATGRRDCEYFQFTLISIGEVWWFTSGCSKWPIFR